MHRYKRAKRNENVSIFHFTLSNGNEILSINDNSNEIRTIFKHFTLSQPIYVDENDIGDITVEHEADLSADYIPTAEYDSDDSYSNELIRKSNRTSMDSTISATNISSSSTAAESKF